VLIGQFQLAQYVQLLPTSVVGGYLAFIGWFCGMSGVGLMAASTEVSFAVLLDNWQFVVPGIAGGVVIYVSVRYLRHMAVLPTCIAVLLLLFYSTLWATTTSIDKAAKSGWIRETDAPPPWYKTWEYLKLDKVAWSVIPELVLTELSMIFVVALSSSLDVAAIELELKEPLDYNGELKMVGLSNLVSGLTGGYTGSYIFSQSIFSLRAGIRSRIAGYVLAACQVVYLLVPFPILAYVPNFFFGSLLSMICVDLMYEWLWDVRNKVTPVEYMVCLATFGLIQVAGVEYGILLGVVVFLLCQRLGFDVGNQRQNAELDEAVDAPSIPINSTDGNPQRYGSL
jgi:SulP family sulfate permease